MRFPIHYQEGIEKFYNTLADLIVQKDFDLYLGHGIEEDILHPELLLFEDTICGEVYDTQLELLLEYAAERGYRIVMNFYASDVVIGNVVVRIRADGLRSARV